MPGRLLHFILKGTIRSIRSITHRQLQSLALRQFRQRIRNQILDFPKHLFRFVTKYTTGSMRATNESKFPKKKQIQ